MKKDINQTAKSIIDQATAPHEKDPLAVALGRRGGLKGGVARAKNLSAKKRSEIAKAGAKARWGKSKSK